MYIKYHKTFSNLHIFCVFNCILLFLNRNESIKMFFVWYGAVTHKQNTILLSARISIVLQRKSEQWPIKYDKTWRLNTHCLFYIFHYLKWSNPDIIINIFCLFLKCYFSFLYRTDNKIYFHLRYSCIYILHFLFYIMKQLSVILVIQKHYHLTQRKLTSFLAEIENSNIIQMTGTLKNSVIIPKKCREYFNVL